MHFFVKLHHQFHRAILFEPCVARVANDLQKSGARITSVKNDGKTIRAQLASWTASSESARVRSSQRAKLVALFRCRNMVCSNRILSCGISTTLFLGL
jgi:hypothetical protein